MSTLDRGPRTIKLWTALILFGTFLSGLAVGVGVFRLTGAHFPRPPGPPPFLPGVHPHELGLSDEQEKQLRTINERHRPAMEEIIRASFPKLRELNERMENEMRAVLSEDQRRRLDESRRRRPMPPPGGFPPGGPGTHPAFVPGGPPPFPPGMGMPEGLPPHGLPGEAPAPAKP